MERWRLVALGAGGAKFEVPAAHDRGALSAPGSHAGLSPAPTKGGHLGLPLTHARESLLAGLNERQLEAVTARPGPLLVLAGPGSGKTLVLTRRAAHLIATGAAGAARVLAITFTNKAADELGQRLARLVGERESAALTIGTMHAVAHRLLVRRYAPAIGRTPRFSIWDGNDARRALTEIVKELDAVGAEPDWCQARISLAKARLQKPADLRRDARRSEARVLARIWTRYEERLRESDALDFDDLIAKAVALLRRRDVAAVFGARFDAVLVDEYQDTNHAQYELVRLLAGEGRNVTVVGDDDQALYGWRGADVENVRRFERDYPDARVVRLERNYRSSARIVGAAARLIAHNRERKPKALEAVAGEGLPVRALGFRDAEEEARAAAGWCRSLIAAGNAPEQLAILYRTHHEARLLEQALLVAALPYRVLGGHGLFERAEVKDALAHLALVANPRDRVAFARALGTQRGVGPQTLARVAAHATSESLDLLAACRQAEAIAGLSAVQRTTVASFGRRFGALQATAAERKLSGLVVEALLASGLPERLKRRRTQTARDQVERLRQLVRNAQRHEAAHPRATLAGFLAQAALVSDGASDDGPAAITLATVHAAKGLEWHCVRLIGLCEGTLPHHRALRDGDEEEERRIAYVALTRAREQLVLTWSVQSAGGRIAARSRFVGECGVAVVRAV
jgi:DNA helicase-2/ATP-dependent DNA helicase PcrA